MCDYICASYLTIVIVFTFCSPTRSEMKNETNRQRSLVLDLRNMISDLFDKADVTEAEMVDKQQRSRKSVAKSEDTLRNYKRAQADNLRREGIDDVALLPLYPCDEFDEGRRSCTNIRQIGTTLTFGVNIEGSKDIRNKYHIRWFRFFKVFKNESEIKEELTTENKPWNINFGEDNTELRISPITETDYSHNYFVASLIKNQSGQKTDKLANLHYLKFYIQPLAIDMGTLYHGEELFINVRSFIELPSSSVLFDWRQSDVDKANNFPRNTRHVSSNMKKNADGSTLIIKEFMDSSDKILSCDVYSNKKVFIARRDFFLKKIAEPDDLNKDLEEEVINERRKRSLQEFYEYVSDSDKDESDYSYADDIKVVDVDPSTTKRNIKKTPPERLNEKLPAYNTHSIQYHRHYRVPSSAFYRERQPVASSYGKKSLSVLTSVEQPSQKLSRHTANSPGRLNRLAPVYSIHDSRYYRLPSSHVYGEQLRTAPFYNSKQSPNLPVNTEQPPSPLANGGRTRSVFTYGEQTASTFTYDGQLDPTMLKSPYLKTLINQANSLANSPATQKNVEFRSIDIESQGILTFDDIESRLISNCNLDCECGIHAFCYGGVNAQTAVFESMFCRCKSDYVGNGIFCWLF